MLEYFMNIKLLTEHHLEFLSLKGGCTGSFESTHVKVPHCWKSHVTAQIQIAAAVSLVIRHLLHQQQESIESLIVYENREY